MRALVTGHRGFVGRHIATALVERGYHVIGVDIKDEAVMLSWSNGGHLMSYVGDCREFFQNGRAQFDLVVHCAAVVGGRTMIDGEPLRLAAEDLSIDAELFRWALRTRPKRMVLFSSSAAYPVSLQHHEGGRALTESDIDGLRPNAGWIGIPDATYGWVKLTLELLADEANALGIRTHVFRPFSGYGADQDDSYPFPAIIRRAVEHVQRETARRAAGEPPEDFHVWGHPESTRDWVHIDDVVSCVLAHVDADEIGPVNICTGRATSFAELARHALLAAGSYMRGHIVGDTSKPMGVFHRVGDPTRMQRVYTPKITIEAGVARAIKELR
jgi:nucleoside-diphosphate-sugar epimerase